MSEQPPLFFVLGSTGSGKTSLAVGLAAALRDRHRYSPVGVVNCDVTQFFYSLPVATNKPTTAEMQGVPHYFLGFLHDDGSEAFPPDQPYAGRDKDERAVGASTAAGAVSCPSNCDACCDEIGTSATVGQSESSPASAPPLLSPPPTTTTTGAAAGRFTVVDYARRVSAFIENYLRAHPRGALIVCGGTAYYAQALLFHNALAADAEEEEEARKRTADATGAAGAASDTVSGHREGGDSDSGSDGSGGDERAEPHRTSPSAEAQEGEGDWGRLNAIDPAVAQRYHPRDTRRLRRLLELHARTGAPPSALLARRPAPRFDWRRCLVAWCNADRDALRRRLDARVDEMCAAGLREEAAAFHRRCGAASGHAPSTSLAEAIGYKEFYESEPPARDSGGCRSDGAPAPASASDVSAAAAVERVKANTRRYARRQVRWLHNRLLPALRASRGHCDTCRRLRAEEGTSGGDASTLCDSCRALPDHVVVVDTTDPLSVGRAAAALPALLLPLLPGASCELADAASTGGGGDDRCEEAAFSFPLRPAGEEAAGDLREPVTQERCELCDTVVCGRGQMAVHLRSKRHRGALRRQALEREQLERFGRVIPPKRHTEKHK